MGLLEDLMGKMDQMIVALNENTKAGVVGSTAPAAETKKAPGRPKKDETPAASTITEADLKAKFEAIKNVDPEARTPALKKLIADQGYNSLKELLGNPDKFDATAKALDDLEATFGAATDADDDL